MLRRHWPLIPILLLALALRLYAIDRSPLWSDEMFSLQSSAARGFYVEDIPRGVVFDPAPRPTSLGASTNMPGPGSLARVYTTQATDTHPPLYFMMLRVWRQIVPDTAAWQRVPSVIASLVLVAALYAAFAVSFSRRLGIIAGLLAALSILQIQYAQEIRGYAQGAACATVAAAALLAIEARGWSLRRGALLGTAAFLAFASLYLTALPLLAIGLHAVLNLRGRDRQRVLLTGGLTALATGIAIGPLLLMQRAHVNGRNAWLTSETPRQLLEVLADTARAAFGQIAPPTPSSDPLVFLACGAMVVFAAVLVVKLPRARVWVFWSLLSLGLLAGWDLAGNKLHLQNIRYTLFAGPGILGMLTSVAALGNAKAKANCAESSTLRKPTLAGRLLIGVPAAALVLALISLPQAYILKNVDWRELTRYADRGNLRPTDLVLVASNSGRQWDNLLYLGLDWSLPGRPFATVILNAPPSANQSAAIRAEAVRRGGLVTFVESPPDLADILPPGWQKTAYYYLPTVGLLQTFRPPTPTTQSTASDNVSGSDNTSGSDNSSGTTSR